MIVSWAADRPTGFTEDELGVLQRIQRRLAIACKMVIQARIARNISEAYLGRQTGHRVLNGLIRLGHGEETRALVGIPTCAIRPGSPSACRVASSLSS
jgi:adenylate cyclase